MHIKASVHPPPVHLSVNSPPGGKPSWGKTKENGTCFTTLWLRMVPL